MRPPMPSIRLSRRARIALTVVVVIIVVLILASSLVGIYTNFLWFKELHHTGVYRTVILTRLALFGIFGVLMAAILGGNIALAYRVRPPFRPMSNEQQNLERYRVAIEPRKKWLLAAIMVLAGLSSGLSSQGDWRTWTLFLQGVSFGQKDPQFHRDISFFAWDYPGYRLMLSFGFVAIIFAILLSAVVHYLVGAIRLQTPGPKITLSARRHLTVLIFVFIALKAIAYWLDRYGLVFSDRGRVTGASYTDVNASLPAKMILFWIAIIIAAGVLASIWLKSAALPVIGFVVLIVLSIVINGIYPAIVQQFTVKPNASTKEAPYIERNILATRAAYGIKTTTDPGGGNVSYTSYNPTLTPSYTSLTTTNPTVANLRVLDPNVVAPTFTALQQIKNVYGFPVKLDIDRYTVDGTEKDYVVGARELAAANLTGGQTNWINKHTYYTHGYGFTAAAADTTVNSISDFALGDIPPTGSLASLTQPDVYYGELNTDYSIVGAPGNREYDGSDQRTTYAGTGGIPLSNFFTRLAFGVKYRETNFLLNDVASAKGAKVIFDRDPRTRIEKIAPFLTVDGDPYPTVVNGRVVWIVDCYTTMANYPYSERQSLSDLTTDSLTATNRTAGQANSDINYIRNSVKATVDAYDGTVTLYQWDNTDPVLKSWMKIFPGLIVPGNQGSQMPSDVLQHVRYPEDLFEVQRSLLEQYHVDDPVQFYNQADKWTVPNDPNLTTGTAAQPPYYILGSEPGSSTKPEFQLTTPMKVNGRSNLAAYISVNSDPGPDYGKMTVQRLPGNNATQGPEQVANLFKSEPTISKDLTLLGQGGSTIIHGNLLTLPVGNSFLFVEPLYVQAANTSSTGGSFPTLQRVLVRYGSDIGYAATLQGALDNLAPGQSVGESLNISGSTTTNPSTSPSPTSSPSSTSTGSPSSTPTQSTAPNRTQLLTQLQAAAQQLQQAFGSGDPAAIASAQTKILSINKQLQALAPASSSPAAASSSPSR